MEAAVGTGGEKRAKEKKKENKEEACPNATTYLISSEASTLHAMLMKS